MSWWPLIKVVPIKTNLQFVSFAKFFGALSAVLCIASVIGVFYPGMKMGIDFQGGAAMELTTSDGRPLDLEKVRSAVDGVGVGDVGVQGIDDDSSAILRFQVPDGQAQGEVVQRVQAAVTSEVGDITYSGVSVVGSKVSSELFTAGLLALGAAVVLMFGYIWFRFEPQFGFGAVAGLLHDVILVFGLIVLMRLEFSLNMVAAILTVI
ncbi:MAG: protein translocase subunit SecF, partial [Brevundimonas sp.]